MTKAEIAEHVYNIVGGFSKREAAELVDAVFDSLKESLESGHKLKISGFGNFVLRDKADRFGRNPATAERMVLPARRVVRFRPSPVLKALINGEAVEPGRE
ncbi:MAG: integration host factor subunit alpha [Polyangiales bacterium]